MSTPKLLLTLGSGLDPAAHGDVLVLDWAKQQIIDQSRFEHRVYDVSHKGLAGATWHEEKLLVATEVEMLEFEVAPLRLVEARSFHFLNDVHHITAAGDRIWICNTGLDCIEELDSDWNPIQSHQLVGQFGRRGSHVRRLLVDDFKKSLRRIRGDFDYYEHLKTRPAFRNFVKLVSPGAYRKNGREMRFSDLRPHVLHPNHVWPWDNDIWVTLWRTGEVVSLRSGTVLADGFGRPHDGIAVDEEFYVTDCQRNRLIVHELDRSGPTLGRRIADRTITGAFVEGFARGVAVRGDLVFVGLTARRGAPSEFRDARIVALNRKTLDPVGEWTIPKEYGRLIYSIVDATEAYA